MLAAIERIVNAEAEASGAPRKPEIAVLDRYALVKNDADATKRVGGGGVQGNTFPGRNRVQETQPKTASEDFWLLRRGMARPVGFLVRGRDRSYRSIPKRRPLARSGKFPPITTPGSHSVIQPTLKAGVEAMVVAAQAMALGVAAR